MPKVLRTSTEQLGITKLKLLAFNYSVNTKNLSNFSMFTAGTWLRKEVLSIFIFFLVCLRVTLFISQKVLFLKK